MVHDMRSVNGVDRRHPIPISLFPLHFPLSLPKSPHKNKTKKGNSPIIQTQREILIQQIRTLGTPHSSPRPLLYHRFLQHRTYIPAHSPERRMNFPEPVLVVCEREVDWRGCCCGGLGVEGGPACLRDGRPREGGLVCEGWFLCAG